MESIADDAWLFPPEELFAPAKEASIIHRIRTDGKLYKRTQQPDDNAYCQLCGFYQRRTEGFTIEHPSKERIFVCPPCAKKHKHDNPKKAFKEITHKGARFTVRHRGQKEG